MPTVLLFTSHYKGISARKNLEMKRTTVSPEGQCHVLIDATPDAAFIQATKQLGYKLWYLGIESEIKPFGLESACA